MLIQCKITLGSAERELLITALDMAIDDVEVSADFAGGVLEDDFSNYPNPEELKAEARKDHADAKEKHRRLSALREYVSKATHIDMTGGAGMWMDWQPIGNKEEVS